jgi:hypothetical protein
MHPRAGAPYLVTAEEPALAGYTGVRSLLGPGRSRSCCRGTTLACRTRLPQALCSCSSGAGPLKRLSSVSRQDLPGYTKVKAVLPAGVKVGSWYHNVEYSRSDEPADQHSSTVNGGDLLSLSRTTDGQSGFHGNSRRASKALSGRCRRTQIVAPFHRRTKFRLTSSGWSATNVPARGGLTETTRFVMRPCPMSMCDLGATLEQRCGEYHRPDCVTDTSPNGLET